MSFARAQRALVRMYFDPAFAAAAQMNPELVLANLDAPLRAQLAALDARALRLDRLRRPRTLSILAEEFPQATAALDRPALEEFFSSTTFHRAIEEDTPLPLAFAAYLAEIAPSEALVLETAVAQARRVQVTEPPLDGYALADGVVPVPLSSEPHRLAIRLGSEVAVVEIATPLWRVVQSLSQPRSHAQLLTEARARGLDAPTAETALAELVEGEIVVRG